MPFFSYGRARRRPAAPPYQSDPYAARPLPPTHPGAGPPGAGSPSRWPLSCCQGLRGAARWGGPHSPRLSSLPMSPPRWLRVARPGRRPAARGGFPLVSAAAARPPAGPGRPWLGFSRKLCSAPLGLRRGRPLRPPAVRARRSAGSGCGPRTIRGRIDAGRPPLPLTHSLNKDLTHRLLPAARGLQL